ncbi:MAG: hypothetical protein A4E63_00271 [Syntrophorhabdus sp. PtaU1.Bin050]|nr:MAG: hypothetical protein A4E63_00271 [Syntrophorhabdus sp. PtaU1.Bin050]
MTIIRHMINSGGSGSVTIQSAINIGIFATAMKRPRTSDPAISTSTMQEAPSDSFTDFHKPLTSRFL